MRILSAPALAQVQAIQPTKPFAWLYDVTTAQTTSNSDVAYLTGHDQPVSWNGNTYNPFPVWHERVATDIGSLPELEVTISNVTRELSKRIFDGKGIAGMPVSLRVVSLNATAIGDPIFSGDFSAISASLTNETATIRLGLPPWLEYEVPADSYSRVDCQFVYKSAECGYAGPLATCDLTLFGANGCDFHGLNELALGLPKMHPRRFGGFPPIPRIAV